MAKQKKKKKGGCLSSFLPATVFVLAIAFAIYTYFQEDDIAKEHLRFEQYFKGNFEKYLAVEKENIQEKPLRTGKLLLMNTRPNSYGVWLNPMFYDLPEEMKALSPEEVSTVVIMEYKKEIYVQGVHESSHIWNAYFRIIDWPSRTIIYRGVLEGEPPSGEDRMSTGPKPSYEMFDFVSRLPEKQIREN